MSKTVDMTVGSPTKHLLKFAAPLIITNIGQQLYMIADGAIVGRGVGVRALAAVGATDWCYLMILWAMISLSQGFSTFIARHFGEKNYKAVNRDIAASIVLCAIIGTVFTAAGLLMAKPLLLLLGTPSDIIDGATVYLITLISGTLIVSAYNMASATLRAFGDGKTPLIAMIISALLNIGLDLVFVFVFHWGIFGAALASIIAQLISFVFCFLRIKRIDCVKLDRDAWHFSAKLIFDMLLFGLPLAFQHVIIALGGIILQSSVNLQGSVFIAGYTATNKVYALLESSGISLGLAASTFLSQNYGAGNFERFKKGVRTALGLVIAMSALVATFTLIFRKYIPLVFLDMTEPGAPEAHAYAVEYLTIITVCLAILYIIHIFRNALEAMKIASWPMASGFAEFVIRVIMAKCIMNIMGSTALFVAEPLAWLGSALTLMIPYFFYSRKRLR